MRRLATVLALVAPYTLAAQGPVIPGLPDVNAGADLFTRVTGTYEYSGCVVAPVFATPTGNLIDGTAYCVHGLLLVGVRPGVAQIPTLAAYLAQNVTQDARLGPVRSEFGDVQYATGTLTGVACPAGCASSFTFLVPNGDAGYQWWKSDPSNVDPDAQFAAQLVRLTVGYTVPPAALGVHANSRAEFALTAIPEPTPLALTAIGLGTVVLRARRRRT